MPRGVNMYDEGRIQQRNYGLSNNVQIVSPGFLTDGLRYLMDIGNSFCYPGSGTIVYDVSGYNINRGSFVDSPTYSLSGGGSLIFGGSGTTDYVSVPDSQWLATEATILVWLYRDGAQLGTAGLLFYSSSLAGLNFFGTTNNLGYHWNASSTTFNYNSGLQPPSLAWSMGAISVYPDRAVFTLCQASGTTTATNTVTHAAVTLNGLRVGHTIGTANRYFKGNIAIAAVYDHALSPDEITQNFNATRARFNI
jgi:hypothetical protein